MKKLLLSILALGGIFAANAQTAENPYSVEDFIAAGATGQSGVYVKGYIVGWADSNGTDFAKNTGLNFNATNAVYSNILLADGTAEEEPTMIIPVQLPSKSNGGDAGAAVRAALNLGDNPQNFHHQVIICGTSDTYFKVVGLKLPTTYSWVGDAPEAGGSTETPTEPAIYSGLNENDANCTWTFDNIKLGEGLDYVWSWKNYNNQYYLNGSSYINGAGVEAEAIAVSPVIDLAGATDVVVSFSHAARFQTTLRELCGIQVREAGTTEWTKLTIPTWPEAGAWTFVNSGDISLKDFEGKKIELAFYYGGSAAGADTWEVKNLVVKGNGGTSTPDDPIVTPPATDDSIYSGLASNGDDWTIDNGTLEEGITYVWKWDATYGMKATAYVSGTRYVTDAWVISPVIDLANCTDVKVQAEQAINYCTTPDQMLFCKVRVEGGEWEPLTYSNIPAGNNWTFNDTEADLAKYEGKKIQLGFEYTSTTDVAATWEVRNLKVTGINGSGVEEILLGAEVYVEGNNIVAPAGARVYNLNGVECGARDLAAGVYVVVANGKAVKVLVK